MKVIGSPFKTLTAAEQACEVMLGYLVNDSPSSAPLATNCSPAAPPREAYNHRVIPITEADLMLRYPAIQVERSIGRTR